MAMSPKVERLGPRSRLALAALAAAIVVVLGLARALKPDPRGFGTHSQLGLSPCTFRELTGQPCPSCGMTTAFSWASRGRLDRAWSANPAGAVIAPICLLAAAWLAVASARGSPRPFRSADAPLMVLVLGFVALGLVNWAVRLSRGP